MLLRQEFGTPPKIIIRLQPHAGWRTRNRLPGPGADRRAVTGITARRYRGEAQRTKAVIASVVSRSSIAITDDDTMVVTPVMAARASMVGSHRARHHCGGKNKRRRACENLVSHRNLPFRVNRSQRLRFRLAFDRRQRLVVEGSLKGTQPLLDRDQVDDGAPGIDQILKRTPDF
jgi:hypothetical protein